MIPTKDSEVDGDVKMPQPNILGKPLPVGVGKTQHNGLIVWIY